MVEPVDIRILSQKVKEDLERVPLDREALRKSLDEIKNAVVLQQPLFDDSVLRTVPDDVLKDIIMNTMHELSSVPSLSQQSRLPASTDGDFVSELSGGNALCAAVLGFDETNPFRKAPIPFLRKLDNVEMLQPMMSLQETKFSFIDNEASSYFVESVQSFGFSVAASLNFSNVFSSSTSFSSNSKIRHSSHQASKAEKIYLYKVGFYPIGAFRLPLNLLEMSDEASSELLNVTNESQAENYLRFFGSHISADLHHYGGLMIYHTQVQRRAEVLKSEDIATAEQKFEASISGGFWKIQAGAAGGSHNSSSHYTMSEGSKEKLSFTVHLDTYGPSTSNPSLFQEILKRDRKTNYLIDKGSFKVLRPVWEIARRTNPKTEIASKILQEVWLKKTQHSSNPIIAQLWEQDHEQMLSDARSQMLPLRKCRILQDTVDGQDDESMEISENNSETRTNLPHVDGLPKANDLIPTTKEDVDGDESKKSNLTLPETSYEHVIPCLFPLMEQLQRIKEKFDGDRLGADASNQIDDKTFARDYPPTVDGSLEYNLLHRLNLESSTLLATVPPPGSGRRRGTRETEKTRIENFDIPSLFKKYPLHECGNIMQFLLERRYAIPILPDLLKNVGLLRVVRRTEMDPFLSDDMNLLRVVIVSYVHKQLSKTAFLLKDGFHVSSSLRKEHDDVCEAEVGQGFIAGNNSSISCIVLHILGPFTGMWDVITEFADYLIIEEPHSQSFDELGSIIAKYEKLTGLPDFVTAWIPSEGSPEYYDEQTPFFIVKSNMQQFVRQVSDDIADGLKDGLKHQNCLTDLFNLPFDAKLQMHFRSIISGLETLDSYRMKVLQLEKSFKAEGLLQAKLRDFQEKNNPSQRDQLEAKIEQEKKRRMDHAGKTEKELLIQLLLHCLSIESVEERILALRAMEDAISSNIMVSRKVEELKTACSTLEANYRDIVQDKGVHDPDVVSEQEKLLQIKEERNNTILSIDHVWREVSLLYCARSARFQNLPKQAATCLLSGIPLELFNGDANMLNVEWTKCVLESLQQMIPNKRILVLSVLGEQSCGKSTLLNVMFGIRFRASVGRCTNGLMMTLIKSENRTKYDYILILDTEGIRSPEHWGLPGCEKRDNQIASLAILPSDATILVVKGENDNALKDILPIVLMAYRGSKLAENKLGTLSSRFFVVYNQVMVTQKDKLESIIQSLSTSLVVSFSTVSNMEVAGRSITFRALLSNASSTAKSDICVLGCVSDGEPPKDVPNFTFSKQVMSFREHIHQSIVETPGWRPRQIINFSEDVGLVWQCLKTADFELSYLSLKERLNHCWLDKEVGKKENDYSTKYQSNYEYVLAKERKGVKNEEELNTTIDDAKAHLSNLMSQHKSDFCKEIDLLLNEAEYRKWRTDVDDRKKNFLESTKSHWHHALELSLRNRLYFDNRLQDYQKNMRDKMNQLFKKKKMDAKDGQQFETLFQEMLEKAEKENPPVDVGQKVLDVYKRSLIIRRLDANLIAPATEKPQETWLKNVWKLMSEKPAKWLADLRKLASSDNKLPEDKLPSRLTRVTCQKLEGKQYFTETVVQEIIEDADKIILEDKTVRTKQNQIDWHNFVRKFLTEELKLIQAKWEESNSIHARLKTKKTEMKQLYLDISTGLQNIDRLNSKLQYFFKEVTSVAFKRELREEIIRSVRKKHWYDSIDHLQGHLDLFLMKVEESYGIRHVLDLINNPSELRRRTVLSLIGKEIRDTEVKWKAFKDRTEQCIRSAFEESKQKDGCKAIAFIQTELPKLLSGVFQSSFFKQELTTQFQVAFDESEFQNTNHEFLQLQIKPIVDALHSCQAQIDEQRLASEVFQILKELSPDNITVCALCEERCELCKGLCFKKRMHDGKLHDTCHQPAGLAGMYFIDSDTLSALACNTTPLDWRFTIDGQKTWHHYRDYAKFFVTWIQPDPNGNSSEYRQYLMDKYNDAIASYHGNKPCKDIPSYYKKDFSHMREKIKCSVLYSEDYPSC